MNCRKLAGIVRIQSLVRAFLVQKKISKMQKRWHIKYSKRCSLRYSALFDNGRFWPDKMYNGLKMPFVTSFVRRVHRAAVGMQRWWRRLKWRCLEHLALKYPCAESLRNADGKLSLPPGVPFLWAHVQRLQCPYNTGCDMVQCVSLPDFRQKQAVANMYDSMDDATRESMGVEDGELEPCPFGHSSLCVRNITTKFCSDTCKLMGCIGRLREIGDSRKACNLCGVVAGPFRSELSYVNMNSRCIIKPSLTKAQETNAAMMATLLADIGDKLGGDKRWPLGMIEGVQKFGVNALNIWSEYRKVEKSNANDLPAELRQKTPDKRRAHERVFLAELFIVWLAVNGKGKFNHEGIAREVISFVDRGLHNRNKKKEAVKKDDRIKTTRFSSVQSRLKDDLHILRRAMPADVRLATVNENKTVKIEDDDDDPVMLDVADHVDIYGVQTLVRGNASSVGGVFKFVPPCEDDTVLRHRALQQCIAELKDSEDEDDRELMHHYQELSGELMLPTEMTVELEFKAGGQSVFVVVKHCGGIVVEAYSTLIPPKFTLEKEARVPDPCSFTDTFGEKANIIGAKKIEISAEDFTKRREGSCMCRDGSSMPAWILTDDSIRHKYGGNIVLVRTPDGFKIGTGGENYTCLVAETPRSRQASRIMMALKHTDKQMTLLGRIFQMLPERFDRHSALTDVEHFLKMAGVVYFGSDEKKDTHHVVPCGMKRHRKSKIICNSRVPGPQQKFCEEFMELCSGDPGKNESAELQKKLQTQKAKVIFKAGDDKIVRGPWTSKKGTTFVFVQEVLEVNAKGHPVKLGKRRKIQHDPEPVKKAEKPWKSIDQFAQLYVDICAHKAQRGKQAIFIAVRNYIKIEKVTRNASSLLQMYVDVCKGTVTHKSFKDKQHEDFASFVKKMQPQQVHRKKWLAIFNSNDSAAVMKAHAVFVHGLLKPFVTKSTQIVLDQHEVSRLLRSIKHCGGPCDEPPLKKIKKS